MMRDGIQTIHDEDGKPAFAVVPWPTYLRLIADEAALSDEALYDLAKQQDDGERLPFEIVEQLSAGENPIGVYRRFRGLTQAQLASAVGLSTLYISQLETGRRKGSLDALQRIAAALRIDAADLLGK